MLVENKLNLSTLENLSKTIKCRLITKCNCSVPTKAQHHTIQVNQLIITKPLLTLQSLYHV